MRTRPMPDVWWYTVEQPNSDGYLPEGDHWQGFTVHDKPQSDNPIVIKTCGSCLLRRSTGYGRNTLPCPCNQGGIKRYKYKLNAKDLDRTSSFRGYRDAIKEELISNERFFRHRLLDALDSKGARTDFADFHVWVQLDIRPQEIFVNSVDIENYSNGSYGTFNPYGRRIDRWIAENGSRYPDYAGIGIMGFQFRVFFPHGQVFFNIHMALPLKKQEVFGRREWDTDWKYRIIDELSDWPPTRSWDRERHGLPRR